MPRVLAVVFMAHVFDVSTVVESHVVAARMDLTAALICKINRLPDPAFAAAICCQTSDVLHERYAEIEMSSKKTRLSGVKVFKVALTSDQSAMPVRVRGLARRCNEETDSASTS